MVIWKDISVAIRVKMRHIRKIGGRVYNSFITTNGDIPVARFNDMTQKFEDCDNPRGRAYAARKREAYRKNIA